MEHDFCFSNSGISIAPMNEDTSELYRKLRNLDENRCFFFTSQIISYDEQKLWFQNYLQRDDEIMFSIFKDNRFVGGCGLYHIEKTNKRSEFGRLLVAKNQRGAGIGQKVLQCVKRIAYLNVEICELYLKVKQDNIAAIKTYEREGFNIVDKLENDSLRMRLDLLGYE